jgi:hypothetical protein
MEQKHDQKGNNAIAKKQIESKFVTKYRMLGTKI